MAIRIGIRERRREKMTDNNTNKESSESISPLQTAALVAGGIIIVAIALYVIFSPRF